MKKNLKKRLLTATAILTAFSVTAVPALAAPTITDTDYEGRGKVEVDFDSKVHYKNLKVTVKDKQGNSYTAKVVDQDSDDLTFVIKNFKCNKVYNYQIKGIKKRSESAYSTVKGNVTIPAASKIKIKKIKPDIKDHEVDFDFVTHVNWKSPKLTIKDSAGNKLKVTITDKDSDELEASVPKLKKGKTYQYELSGIKNVDSSKYKTIKGTFKTK